MNSNTSEKEDGVDDNNLSRNDCKCNAPVGETRPKVKHYSNIPNGASSQDSIPGCSSVNNNNVEKKINSVETYLANNVDNHDVVDKCPAKVSNGGTSYQNGFSRDDEETDSSSGNEDGCIYTYKGDQFADLPNCFWRSGNVEEMSREEVNREIFTFASGNTSPEMDFLEMDFDPGPSLEQDSDHSDTPDFTYGPVPELPMEDDVNDLNLNVENISFILPISVKEENDLSRFASNCPRHQVSPEPVAGPSNVSRYKNMFPQSRSTDSNLSCLYSSANSWPVWPQKDLWGHHVSSGDLCSPSDGDGRELSPMLIDVSPDARIYNLHSTFYHCMMAKKLMMNKETNLFSDDDSEDNNGESRLINSRESKSSVERVMIWSEQDACVKQVTQISTSACGATAVINVLMALNLSFSLDKVKEGVSTRLRSDSAPLPAYLFSRSCAGATHEDLIRGISHASDNSLYARFFPMFPARNFSLSKWLSHWIKKGVIPIATLNLQHGVAPDNPIPDAWHHQMIFGVSSRGIYLTNPIECVEEGALWQQLCSPSLLKIRRNDVLNRWTPKTNLRPLMNHPDQRWKKVNVLGQVVNLLRESTMVQVQGRVITQHITIPASYSSGITLVIPKDSPSYADLVAAEELPLYQDPRWAE